MFQRGCVSGGGDNTVKFWQFELITDEKSESKAKVLSLLHTRTLKLEDSVLCVKLSPNSKYIAVALLDSTVKIFFVDTFKVVTAVITSQMSNCAISVLFVSLWTQITSAVYGYILRFRAHCDWLS